ncbi:hypothetical protein [Jatrophihabitans lederbergiae]|uniref:Uncharacterized protein n=1 Tax=Jatrophihabitans lederbergiae TaxID=3075547 RepID=A0ABU2JIX0_9ACTN|nr:hypothetical protein [Jatrophihabitans sp. DSM 44399]MDT0264188.1 hypothetical protein [Jatrophihabitans sp. DSM 44399]
MSGTLDPLAEVRRSLIVEFAALPGEGDVVAWQRRLADAIIDAEAGSPQHDSAELKWHRHLLRVIGDALVHALLPAHTIRALSRHPGRPPSLSAQGEDFDFVFECARTLRRSGAVPIVADLTTLVGIGDLVGWGGGGVGVYECKNRTPPMRMSTSGRVARQRLRGERTEEYLTGSRIEEEGGPVREAYDFPLPEPEWEAVRDLLERCLAAPTKLATHSFGTDDTLIACSRDTVLDDVADQLPTGEHLAMPAMAVYSELIESADHRLWAPSSYPLSGDLRWRLLENELSVIRFVDMGALEAEFTEGAVRGWLTPRRGEHGFEVGLDVAGFEPITFTHQLVGFCLWMPVPVSAMRATLIDHARVLVAQVEPGQGLGSAMNLAEGDTFVYSTAYRAGEAGLVPGPRPLTGPAVPDP